MQSIRYFCSSVIVLIVLTGCTNTLSAPTQTPAPPMVTPLPTETPIPTAAPTSTLPPTITLTPTPTWIPQGPGRVEVPILLYHHIAVSPINSEYYTSPDKFAEQMKLLHDWDYHTIPISLLVKAINEGAALPPNPVIVSFDDGNLDVYTNAFPVMQQYGFIGVFYLVSEGVGQANYVSTIQVQEMTSAGWEVGSHSLSHRDLKNINNQNILYTEIYQSRLNLEENLGVPVKTFAFPFGNHSEGAFSMVHSAGYIAAVGLGYSADQGKGNLYYMERRPINGHYDVKNFAALLPWQGNPDLLPTTTPTATATATRTPIPTYTQYPTSTTAP